MILAKSNVLSGVTPSVLIGSSIDNPANITDPDFSANYFFSSTSVTISFGAVSQCSYVALAGMSYGEGSGFGLYDGSTRITGTSTTYKSNCMMFYFQPRVFTDLQIKINFRNTTGSTYLTYAAAGESIELPNNGEQSGYSRAWLGRGLTQLTATNSNSAPIATLKYKKPISVTLSVPNVTEDFSVYDWQDFLDFASGGVFFLREKSGYDDLSFDLSVPPQASSLGKSSSAYICFDPDMSSPTAHSQTRDLNNLSLKFKVFNGL